MARARVRNLIGANMSVRTDVLREVGGFDDRFGRLEETEFCVRASRRFPTRDWVHSPRARVLHHIAPHRARWRFFVSRCYQEGIAKARMVERTGRDAGLSSERAYLSRTLPRGVARGLRSGVAGDAFGPVRAGAIVWGAAATATGYARGRLGVRMEGRAATEGIARRGANP
jgi:hypothetical protein